MPSLKALIVPNLTPFKPDLTPDTHAFVEHAKWLLNNGADGRGGRGNSDQF